MNKSRALAVASLILCLWVLFANTAAAQPPPPPHAFFGTVTISDQFAPVGTVVEARGEGVRTSVPGNPITTKFAGYYGGPSGPEDKLIVQGHLGEGDRLSFYINGQRAQVAEPAGAWQDTYPFHSLALTPLNLRLGGTKPSPSLAEILQRPTPAPPTVAPSAVPTRTPTPIPPIVGIVDTATPGVPAGDVPAPTAVHTVSPAASARTEGTPTSLPPATLSTPTPPPSQVVVAPDNTVAPAPAATQRVEAQPTAVQQVAEPTRAATLVRPTLQARATKTPQVFAAQNDTNDREKTGSNADVRQQALSTTSNGLNGAALAAAAAVVLLIAAALLFGWRRRQRATSSAKEA